MKYSSPEVSIIFPAKNEGENVRKTMDSLFSSRSLKTFEVIIVDDGSTDGCCDFLENYPKRHMIHLVRTEGIGAANARNLGAKYAKGKYLAFCDAHLFFTTMWIDKLLKPLEKNSTDAICPGIADMKNPASIGYGQTLKKSLEVGWNKKLAHLADTAVLPGGCFVIPATVFNDIGGFEKGFKTWGFEDIEISIKLWLFGYRCSVFPNVKVLHLFRSSHPYQLSFDHVDYNLLRMAYSHFSKQRINQCKKLLKNNPLQIEKKVLKDGVMQQRIHYFKQRKYDDDWYFKKFNLTL